MNERPRARATYLADAKLKKMKKAPHEFKAATATSITLALAAVALPLMDELMGGAMEEGTLDGDSGVAIRRRRTAMLVATALVGFGVVGASVFRPISVFISEGENFNARYEVAGKASRNCVVQVVLEVYGDRDALYEESCRRSRSPVSLSLSLCACVSLSRVDNGNVGEVSWCR